MILASAPAGKNGQRNSRYIVKSYIFIDQALPANSCSVPASTVHLAVGLVVHTLHGGVRVAYLIRQPAPKVFCVFHPTSDVLD